MKWLLNLKAMVKREKEFFTFKNRLSRYIKNIYQTGELSEVVTAAKIATVQNGAYQGKGVRGT